MELYRVKSSNIKAVGYNIVSQRMVVQFHSGKKWAYTGVPPEVYINFLGAKSMGIFFTREVRGKYGSEKL